MVTKFHTILFAALALCIFLSTSIVSSSYANTEDFKFTYERDSVAYNAVRRYLDSKIKEIYGDTFMSDVHVPIGIGRVDLNGDKKDEIIAYLYEDIYACRHDTYECPFFIFTYTRSGLVQIGEFYAGSIKILDETTNGIRDIRITKNPKGSYEHGEHNHNPAKGLIKNVRSKKVIYKWAGRSYQPVQDDN